MKNLLIILFLGCSLLAQSQTVPKFSFEEGESINAWTPSEGERIYSSDEHYKDGVRSLCWETEGEKSLTVAFNSFTASQSAYLYIYNSQIENDTLIINFLGGGKLKRTARVLLNYAGWRDFERCYTEDYGTQTGREAVDQAQFILKKNRLSANQNMRRIFLDGVEFHAIKFANRRTNYHMILDVKQFKNAPNYVFNFYANPADIEATATAKEIADYLEIKKKYEKTPNGASASALKAAKAYATKMNITRNLDGTVKGKIIKAFNRDDKGEITDGFVTQITNCIQYLASTASTDPEANQLFNDLLDHALDQGLAESTYFIVSSSNYTSARDMPLCFLKILPACNDRQRAEVLKLLRWITQYGRAWAPANSYYGSIESDMVYNFTPHYMTIASYQVTPEEGVREMKAVKRWLERCTDYTPGKSDILKPDGTGFHHSTHYNNYMYSYKTWGETINRFKGTEFRFKPEPYERFKKAVLAVYTMATKGENTGHYFSNTLCGRNPFGSGINLQFDKGTLHELVLTGGDVYGKAIDEELAAAYNYFYDTKAFDVAPKSLDGFYQFNFSPTGIYRRKNWTATMHAPTRQFWGAEIYDGQNRFGRYQSHGALDVMYDGSTAKSGYGSSGGGYDWNVIPGTTTVHYTVWNEMQPKGNTTQRFDQFTGSKSFSGALSWKDCGIYTTDFDQTDSWGGQCFTPTNLVFKKSIFAFENVLINMGNDISASGDYKDDRITATNLFQNINSNETGNLFVNGNVSITEDGLIISNEDTWIVSPQTTGYFIPKGNDPLVIKHGNQSSPGQNGKAATTTVKASKAYFDHGIKSSDKSYLYVAVPATDAIEMATIVADMKNDGGSYYKVEAKNSKLHALTYKPLGITAYSIFEANKEINVGYVEAAESEMLLMNKYNNSTGILSFAACNPNLRWGSNGATPTETGITVKGKWALANEVAGVGISSSDNLTTVYLTLTNGEPLYFDLKGVGTGVSKTNVDDMELNVYVRGKEVFVSNLSGKELRVYDISGKPVKAIQIEGETECSITLDAEGYYIVRTDNGMVKKIIVL